LGFYQVNSILLMYKLSSKICINLYNKYKSTYFYDKLHGNVGVSADEMNALKLLREDKSIIICKANKGNAVVLMNKEDYDI